MTLRIQAIAAVLLCASIGASAAPPASSPGERVDVRPIPAARCYDCHGEQNPKGGLRLTSRAAALKGGDSEISAFIAGQSSKSEILLRVTSRDKDEIMPRKGDVLSARETGLLRQWIEEE